MVAGRPSTFNKGSNSRAVNETLRRDVCSAPYSFRYVFGKDEQLCGTNWDN